MNKSKKIIKPTEFPIPPWLFNILHFQLPPGIDRPLDNQFSGKRHSLPIKNSLLDHPAIPHPTNVDFERFVYVYVKRMTQTHASPWDVFQISSAAAMARELGFQFWRNSIFYCYDILWSVVTSNNTTMQCHWWVWWCASNFIWFDWIEKKKIGAAHFSSLMVMSNPQ